ncbi:NAD(P)/FAD-dependent oxidoreductase [Streptomyces fuscichromogenes]|uniref:NAD(P)/FAD-dependent oxidoreductase n=1 Tax=Streptomyces fuscichromogenes TaxID=1324013 RepID=UPI00382EB88D
MSVSGGRVVVVGASLAGVRVVKALRRRGFDGELVLVGEEGELPYDRPPLSKGFLSSQGPVAVRQLEPESFYEGVEVRLGARASGLSLRERSVLLADGSRVRADHVVVTTGARARSLPGFADGDRVARLRTADDARRIRSALTEARHVLVLGAGFIGCEVAAAARRRGVDVTVVEPAPTPVQRGVGALVGGTIAALHRDRGVDLRLGVSVECGQEHSGGVIVSLTDGTLIETDFVVLGVGAAPNTEWLKESGLDVSNGLLCDDRCRAVGGGGHVWAAGDVAAWPSGRTGERVRIEHWTNAVEQAGVLAVNLLDDGTEVTHDPVPYVWSDQYEHKIQILGRVSGDDDTTLLRGSLDERQFSLAYSRHGRIRGLVAFDLPREIAARRPLVAAGAPLAGVLDGRHG